MMITRKADYAVRCVLHLAEKPGEVVMLSDIAREREIPRSFLSKIMQALAREGIVQSTRGVKGGFSLARRPDRITLLDVVTAIDGPVAMNICAVDSEQCSLSSTCVVHPVWKEIRRDVEKKLTSWTFKKLLLK